MTNQASLKKMRDEIADGKWNGRYDSRLPLLPRAWKAYNGSTDAAIFLCEATLPEWKWVIGHKSATVWFGKDYKPDKIFNSYGVPTRALLLCVLDAMIWEAQNKP
jgi:hypothetical protein